MSAAWLGLVPRMQAVQPDAGYACTDAAAATTTTAAILMLMLESGVHITH